MVGKVDGGAGGLVGYLHHGDGGGNPVSGGSGGDLFPITHGGPGIYGGYFPGLEGGSIGGFGNGKAAAEFQPPIRGHLSPAG